MFPSYIHANVVFRLYATLKRTYPRPNERCPLVDTQEFVQQQDKHPSFGRPVNGSDLFHGTKRDAYGSIVRNGFDDHYFKSGGMFGGGAYFADDPGLSMGYLDEKKNPSPVEGHMFVCNVILGNMDDSHYRTPIHSSIGADFRPPLGVDSIKGRIWWGSILRQAEYIVYRFGQCKPTYLLVFDH